MSAELLATVASLPFENVPILYDTDATFEDIEKLRLKPNDPEVVKLFKPAGTVPGEEGRESAHPSLGSRYKSFYKGLAQRAYAKIPFTLITFGTYELVSDAVYSLVLRDSKYKYSGLSQVGIGFGAGWVAGATCYLLQEPVAAILGTPSLGRPAGSLAFLSMMSACMFSTYNVAMLAMGGHTLGQGRELMH